MITINGKTYAGNSVSIINGKITIDGKDVEGSGKDGIVKVCIMEGSPVSITTDASVECYGAVQGNVKAGGSISCGDVGGDVKAGGSVSCDDVGGNVDAGGSVSCDVIQGKVI